MRWRRRSSGRATGCAGQPDRANGCSTGCAARVKSTSTSDRAAEPIQSFTPGLAPEYAKTGRFMAVSMSRSAIARRANGPDDIGQMRVEQGDETRDALDVLLDDRIGLVERPLRTGDAVVVDLHGQDRTVGDGRICGQAGECGDAAERRKGGVRRPDRNTHRGDGSGRQHLTAGVDAVVREGADADVRHPVDVDDERCRTKCVEAHIAVVVGLDDQPVRCHRRDCSVVVHVGPADGTVGILRQTVVAAVCGHVSTAGDAVDRELADNGLASNSFGHRYAPHTIATDERVGLGASIGSVVRE